MARQASKLQENDEPAVTSVEEALAIDYASNMFSEGHNRTASIRKTARGYDAAAHRGDEESSHVYGETGAAEALLGEAKLTQAEPLLKQDTSRSREGTQAAGRDDESGGFLGGATEEVDALEASAAPVDRHPRMKN